MKNKISFRFSGKMVKLLGGESVSSDTAAMFELIKNSYDADSTNVSIKFKNFSSDDSKNGQIIIEDDGDGMTFNEIKDSWMVIGAYTKNDRTVTDKNRRVVGNKGIGRFATEKIAKNITLISRSKRNKEEVRLYIDWSKYESRQNTFDEINHDIEIDEKRENPNKHGTQIILTNIKEKWNEEKIIELKKSIQSIIIPKELKSITNDSFDVMVDAYGLNVGIEQQIQSLLLKKPPYKLTATILKNEFDCPIKLEKFGKQVDEGRLDFKNTDLKSSGEKWTPFGKCKMTIYFFPGQNKYEEWNKYYKTALKIFKITDTLKEIHGIKIYRDGFWVRPYGEIGNDWLGLEAGRVQSNLRVGNTRVIGIVQINQDENPEIIDTTTRERLVENRSFKSLKRFVTDSIKFLEKYLKEENERYNQNKGKIEHENVIGIETDHLLDIIADLDIPAKERKMINKSVTKVKKTFSDFKSETNEDIEKMINLERALRNLASLGISSATTAHEIANILVPLKEIPKSIRKELKCNPIQIKNILNNLDEADEKIDAIKKFMLFVRHYILNLREDYAQKQKRTNLRIKPIIEKILQHFMPLLESAHIEITQKYYPSDISVYMNRADFESIFVNLLTNSINILARSGNIKEKKIRITVENTVKKFKLKFSDNGLGISENNKNKVFQLFYSTNEEGTGLGLPIIKEIVEEYEGTVEVKTSELKNGATFEILIPFMGVKK